MLYFGSGKDGSDTTIKWKVCQLGSIVFCKQTSLGGIVHFLRSLKRSLLGIDFEILCQNTFLENEMAGLSIGPIRVMPASLVGGDELLRDHLRIKAGYCYVYCGTFSFLS